MYKISRYSRQLWLYKLSIFFIQVNNLENKKRFLIIDFPGVTTVELDNLAAQKAASMTVKHPHYGILAGRIAVSNLHKETKAVFSGLYLFMKINSICI